MLGTALTKLLGIEVPIANAPMTPQAGGALARAVSEAGGLGMLGFDPEESDFEIVKQVAIVQREPKVPFGIGLIAWVLERKHRLLEIAIEAKPTFISISFGDPARHIPIIREAGILTGAQVQNRKWAQVALDAGVDVLIAQGTEAGGHTGAVGTLPLLQIVLEMTNKPVIAAGGIATGRGLAAVLAAGAAGALIGTPFLLAQEARNTDATRARISASDETQTIYTRAYDRIEHKDWPQEWGGRALRTPFLERWTDHEDEMLADKNAAGEFRPEEKIYAGQSVGLMHDVKPAAEIVRGIAGDAQRRIDATCKTLS
jgi:nitronate monooxygenase